VSASTKRPILAPVVVYRIIGLAEVLGAGWSLPVLLRAILSAHGAIIPWSFLVVLLFSYSFVGWAGVQLLKMRSIGEPLSILAQTAQLLQITAGSVAFRFVAGYQLAIGVVNDRVGLFAGLTASVNLWRGPSDPSFIGLNLVPLAFIVALIALPDTKAPSPLAREDGTTSPG